MHKTAYDVNKILLSYNKIKPADESGGRKDLRPKCVYYPAASPEFLFFDDSITHGKRRQQTAQKNAFPARGKNSILWEIYSAYKTAFLSFITIRRFFYAGFFFISLVSAFFLPSDFFLASDFFFAASTRSFAFASFSFRLPAFCGSSNPFSFVK